MIIQVYINDIVKEYFFADNVMDGRYKLQLYTQETGLDNDIEFYIDVNNGVKRIAGREVNVILNKFKNDTDTVIEPNNNVVLEDSVSKSKIEMSVYQSDENVVLFKKYITSENVEVSNNGQIYFDDKQADLFILSHEDNKTYVIPHSSGVYLNGKTIKGKSRIRFGEIILYKKFKLIYFGNVIALNNPDNKVRSSLNGFYYEEYKEKTDNIQVVDKEIDEYFTRSPRITHKLITDSIDVDPPTNKKNGKERPLIYTIGPSMTMSLGMIISIFFMIRANSGGSSMIPSAMMACTMFTGAVLWPILSRNYNKKQDLKEEELRQTKYKEYIGKIETSLCEKNDYNRSVYNELYPSLELLVQNTFAKDDSIWNHTPFEKGFLDVRIGKGARKSTIEINAQKERFSIEEDELRDLAPQIKKKYEYISDVPISVDLNSTNILGVVGDRTLQLDMLKLITLRIVMTHSYDEVKIILLYRERDAFKWSFAKWLPHCWSSGKKERYLADSREGTFAVLSRIKEIYFDRKEMDDNAGYVSMLPHYIVFVTDYELVRGNSNIIEFIETAKGHGITFVLAYDTIGRLPSTCNNIVQLSRKECTVYDKLDESGKMTTFVPDIAVETDAEKIAGVLSGIKVSEAAEEVSVPENLSFLGLYRANSIEELVIERRWKEAQPYKTLEAPLGIGGNNEIFSLNIHEKFHGPHGLVAGTTGSGKSECIQSYILSMAINYHPYDVAFVLIDYKGGGMANAFTDLPHVVGTITNLEGNQIKRSLVSLKSELKRRQKIFKEYKVNHIDSYQMKYKKGLATEPMPHLILVSDEFAELKSQEPEFMNELISTARIGRSLGVHLILATQKPSGVVNDQIWSNTRFRICLKVADRMDSKEMLKRDEAASITLPGRCYVQVGNDEIFKLIQSGYSGEKFVKNNISVSTANTGVSCIDLQGNELYRTTNKTEGEATEETQLSAIVAYIKNIAQKEGLKQLKLWLDPLPKELHYSKLDNRPGGFDGTKWNVCMEWLDPYIGIYDEPEMQKQGIVDVNMGKNGHLILYGAPGTGKTTFLQTLIYSIAKRYSPDFVHMYVLDFGSRSLSYCKELPHISDVLFSDDEDKLKKLFQRIESELNARKKKLAEYGVGNLPAYMQASGEIVPAMIIIIDNYAAFSELYNEYETNLIKTAREGGNYGIFLVMTSASVNGIKRRITENIKMLYTLQLNDQFDYANILGRTEGVVPESTKGRGLVKFDSVLEFQTALACDEVNEVARVNKIKEEFLHMSECWTGARPKPLPVIPEDMSIYNVSNTAEYKECLTNGLLPLGYDAQSIDVISVDLKQTPVFRICGDMNSGRKNTVAAILELEKNCEFWICDDVSGAVAKKLKDSPAEYAISAEEINAVTNKFIMEMSKRFKAYKKYSEDGGNMNKKEFMEQFTRIVFIVADFENFFRGLSQQNLNILKEMLKIIDELKANIINVYDISVHNKYKVVPETKRLFEAQYGLCFGKSENLSAFSISVPYNSRNKETVKAGTGFYVLGSSYTKIVTPLMQ